MSSLPRSSCVLGLAVTAFLAALPLAAAEGMWTLHGFPTGKVAEELGVAVDQRWLDTVQRATVRLDGGCTGSFASPQGLVLTNNHCTWGCIRDLSRWSRRCAGSTAPSGSSTS